MSRLLLVCKLSSFSFFLFFLMRNFLEISKLPRLYMHVIALPSRNFVLKKNLVWEWNAKVATIYLVRQQKETFWNVRCSAYAYRRDLYFQAQKRLTLNLKLCIQRRIHISREWFLLIWLKSLYHKKIQNLSYIFITKRWDS